jgi:hypothetical protein
MLRERRTRTEVLIGCDRATITSAALTSFIRILLALCLQAVSCMITRYQMDLSEKYGAYGHHVVACRLRQLQLQ